MSKLIPAILALFFYCFLINIWFIGGMIVFGEGNSSPIYNWPFYLVAYPFGTLTIWLITRNGLFSNNFLSYFIWYTIFFIIGICGFYPSPFEIMNAQGQIL